MKPRAVLTLLFALLAPRSALSAAESPIPLADQARLPSFSWAQVPRYMHIRKDTAFTPDEIRYLATFPLVTFEKSTGNKDSGATEAGTLKAARAIKAINPVTKILYYRNVIVHYGGYAANAALAEIPKAFLVGRDGSDKLVRGRIQAYDLSNQALRAWWLANAKQVCADPAIDGLFLDGVVKILEPAFLRSEIGEVKKAAELEGYATMMQDMRQLLGPEKLMVANILRARFPDSGLSRLQAFDGSYLEGFEGAVAPMSRQDYVAKGMAAFQEAARRGYLIAFTCGVGKNLQDADEAPRSGGDVPPSVESGDRFTYLLALFLVCAERHSYFHLHDGYDAKTSKTWMTHRRELDRPLGAPQGPAVQAGYRYTREFAHASVRLDIEKQTGSIQWK
jgi:hypothetical protein